MGRFGAVIGAMIAAGLTTGCQSLGFQEMPEVGSFLATTADEVPPPAGFISFCLRFPDQCAAPTDQPELVHLDAQMWQTLTFVNDKVNRTIRVEDDAIHYGRAEYWTIASDGYGDCDDFALTKRKELIGAGLPEKALRVAVVRTWGNIGHAVLTVATDQGDYVLDNLNWEILAWNETPYLWISRQQASNPMGWVSVQGANRKSPAHLLPDSFATTASR